MRVILTLALTLLVLSAAAARQEPATALSPGKASTVLFDLGHHNLIAENPARVDSVSAFLTENGYLVKKSLSRFDDLALREVGVVLIVNARAERNVKDWALPAPSAFEEKEIEAVRRWVDAGGGLLLAVDHMPFPGGAADLASAFGIEFVNGFVIDESKLKSDNSMLPLGGVISFSRRDGTLADHPITNGRTPAERIDTVTLDTGSVFSVRGDATPLLTVPGGFVTLTPHKAWQFTSDLPRRAAQGGLQGAALHFGKGRVAVFADAGAVMTPELAGQQTDPDAALKNAQLFRNAVHWLDNRP